jgi:hypothetical protein
MTVAVRAGDPRALHLALELLGFESFDGHWLSQHSSWGAPEAVVLYHGFNGANIDAHIAIAAGSRGLTRAFLRLIFAYPFGQLGCKRITANLSSLNTTSLDLCQRLGFTHEATLKDALPDSDILVMRMLKADCLWL